MFEAAVGGQKFGYQPIEPTGSVGWERFSDDDGHIYS